MAHLTRAENLLSLESEDVLTAGTLGFMPRLFVLTTLPHSRPDSHRFERVNGRHSVGMSAPRRVGLPYGSYPRLLLAYFTTQAVRTKSPEIQLGATPNDLARKLGLSVISGPRGTAPRLLEQLCRLLSMRLEWKTSLDLAPRSAGTACVTAGAAWELNPLRRLFAIRPTWRSHVLLGQHFFAEITRSAVPVDLRAIGQLRRSPLAVDLYVWLTYRTSYLKKPTLVPWQGLQDQIGSDYGRLRDFRSNVVTQLENVIRVYPTVRVSQAESGLRLNASPPHVHSRP